MPEVGDLLTDGERLVEVTRVEANGNLMVLDSRKPVNSGPEQWFLILQREYLNDPPFWRTPEQERVRRELEAAAAEEAKHAA
jgi:hypothetical protein